MVLTIVILLLLMVLLAFDSRNRFSILLSIMAFGCTLSFVALTYQISLFCIGYGIGRNNVFSELDTRIYVFLVQNCHIPFYSVLRVSNFGRFLCSLAAVFLYKEVNGCRLAQRSSSWISRNTWGILLGISVLSLIFYDPLTAMYLYVRAHASAAFYSVLKGVAACLRLLNIAVLVSPVIALFLYMHQLKPVIFKRQTFYLASSMGLLMTGYICIFLFGNFGLSVSTLYQTGFWLFALTEPDASVSFLLPTVTILLMGICVVLQMLFRVDTTAVISMEKRIRNNLKQINGTLEDTLHSYKNVLFAMQLQMRKIRSAIGNTKQPEVEKMSALVNSVLDETTQMLDNLSAPRYRFHKTALSKLVLAAVEDTAIPEKIRVCVDESVYDHVTGYYDRYHIKKAIVNILSNAADAIVKAKKENGMIKMEMTQYFHWAVLLITDNGIGIPKALLRRIFLPHYSSHNNKLHFGLGMSYVYKVVNAHLGKVKVYSKPMAFTTVALFLPIHDGWRTK